jgi:hypothetical protein
MLVMHVAGAWYPLGPWAWYTSGTFWAGAGTVTAVLGAVAAMWVSITVGFPRRRLYYGMPATARLLINPAGMRSDLELRRRGTPLADPRVLTIELVSHGLKDIPIDAYKDRQPLQLDVGAHIVEVLQVASSPDALAAPNIRVDGTSLKIGPSLIGKRHEITITVLTDGEEPSLTCPSPLIGVRIRQRTDDRLPAMLPALLPAALIGAGFAGMAVAGVAAGATATVVRGGVVMGVAEAGLVVLLVLVVCVWVIATDRRKSHTPTTKR